MYNSATVKTAVIIWTLSLADCAGGGGAGMGSGAVPAPPTMSGSSGNSNPPVAAPCCSDTGLTGIVCSPAPASFGTNPLPAQIATPGGPTFDDSSGTYPPPNVPFPALASFFQPTPAGLSAASTGESASVTLLTYNKLQLVVPAVNLNVTWSDPPGLIAFPGDEPTFGLSYVVLGGWISRDGTPPNLSPYKSAGYFAFGYETSPTAMPASGTASFSGFTFGTAYTSVAGHILAADLQGTATFSTDFASGKLTGALTNIFYGSASTLLSVSNAPWNDVSVNASIGSGTNRFSGATAVTSAPQNTFSLKPSATGRIDGAFYGPAAQNIGAIWTLSDGTTSAIGGVAAGH